MPDRRRRLPRHDAEWPGKFMIEGDDNRRWGSCLVLDISVLGAGLELVGLPPSHAILGRPLRTDVQTPAGASITLQIMGKI